MENKKIKEEFVVFEELDYKEETPDITEINRADLNNQVNIPKSLVSIQVFYRIFVADKYKCLNYQNSMFRFYDHL